MTRGVARVAALLTVAVIVAAVIGFTVLQSRDDHGGDDVSGSSASPSAPSPSPSIAADALFGPAPTAAADQPPDTTQGALLRSRYVSFRSDVLPTSVSGRTLTLDFFDDAMFVGTVDRIDRQDLLTSWSGPLDQPRSLFVITKTADRYQVTASTTEGSFTMSLTTAGFYQVAQVDQPKGGIDQGGLSLLNP